RTVEEAEAVRRALVASEVALHRAALSPHLDLLALERGNLQLARYRLEHARSTQQETRPDPGREGEFPRYHPRLTDADARPRSTRRSTLSGGWPGSTTRGSRRFTLRLGRDRSPPRGRPLALSGLAAGSIRAGAVAPSSPSSIAAIVSGEDRPRQQGEPGERAD